MFHGRPFIILFEHNKYNYELTSSKLRNQFQCHHNHHKQMFHTQEIMTTQLQIATRFTLKSFEKHQNSLPTAEVHERFPNCRCSSVSSSAKADQTAKNKRTVI